jgi:hypothetical protein
VRSLERRLERLEEQTRSTDLSYDDWPLVEQVEDALCYVKLHMRWGSVAACTDRELYCLGLLIASWEHPDTPPEELSPVSLDDFPENVQKHVSRLDPRLQPERDAWLRKEAGYFVRELEELPARLAEIEEQVRARTEESRRRDREFLERRRARQAPLLPPLDTTIPD